MKFGRRWRRHELAAQRKKQKEELKKKRKRDEKETIEAGETPRSVQKQKTLETLREKDDTMVSAEDEEVLGDESFDEFASYFSGECEPKIIITSCYKPTKIMYAFLMDLLKVFPNSFYYARRNYHIKEICDYASEREFTDLIIVNEDKKAINAMTMVHLPYGPTAYFKLTNPVLSRDIAGHGRVTGHRPEVILNRFNTRVGHRVGRFLGALFNQKPEFRGRRVATFHNQRDFIFFRHHRYVFDENVDESAITDEDRVKARLQELGPRFTLKLRWLQCGTFDTKHGEFEWVHRQKEMDTSRRKFHL